MLQKTSIKRCDIRWCNSD